MSTKQQGSTTIGNWIAVAAVAATFTTVGVGYLQFSQERCDVNMTDAIGYHQDHKTTTWLLEQAIIALKYQKALDSCGDDVDPLLSDAMGNFVNEICSKGRPLPTACCKVAGLVSQLDPKKYARDVKVLGYYANSCPK